MNLLNPFAKDAGGGVTRTIGVVYVSDYVTSLLPPEYKELGRAAVVVAFGVWSIYQKYVARQKLLTAAASPQVMTEKQVEQKAAIQAPPVTTPATVVPTIQ